MHFYKILYLFSLGGRAEGNLPPRVRDKAVTADMSAAHHGTSFTELRHEARPCTLHAGVAHDASTG